MASKKVQTLKNSILEFYKHHYEKRINYTHNDLKNCELSKTAIYRLMGNLTQKGNIDCKIKMFENLNAKVHITNQNSLASLLKF